MATYTDNYNLIKPSYSEIADVAVINTNMNTIDDIMHSSQVSLAPAYDVTQTYNTGDVVMYELLMYKCTDDNVTGTWNASKWERITASECGDSGSDVEANPTGTATEELNKLRVDNTIYSIPEGSEVVVYGEASGSIAKFDDGSNKPMSKCKIDINAVQDLHGYDSPWVGGSGKNLLNYDTFENKSINSSGVERTASTRLLSALINVTENTTYFISFPTGYKFSGYCNFDSSGNWVSNVFTNNSVGISITPTSPKIKLYFQRTDNEDIVKSELATAQLELGSTATSYAPYSNICPIGGFNGGNVIVSPTTNAQDGTTYSVSWQSQAGTVYGGNIDLVSGVLTVTHANIASYNGETLPSTWISDRDVYSVGGTPTTGAQVVYELATPLTYQLTPIQVNSLLGINNVWNDTNGETEVKYIRDLNTTVNQLVQHLTYGYGGTPSFNGNDGDVHIVLDSLNKKKGEFMWLNNQWTLIDGSGEEALKVYDNGVEGVGWTVTGGMKNATNISLTVGAGTFTNYAITNSAVNVTNYSTLTVICKYRDQNYTKVIDLTNVSGSKYISFLYVTDSSHNECAVGLTDTSSPAPTYRVDSRNGGTSECIMYSCTLE